MRGTLQTFRAESEADGMGPTDLSLFQKFYAELYSLLTAIIDRKSFEESGASRIEALVESITQDISDEFKKIDLWDLIDFTDLAEIARIEIENYESDTNVTKETLAALLERFDTFVSETLPDVGDTLLSRNVFVKAINAFESENQDLPTFLKTLISLETEKPDEWMNEANFWAEELSGRIEEGMPFSNQLHTFLELAYDRLGEGATPESVLERIRTATTRFEQEYKNQVVEWEKTCQQIDQDNIPIKENNAKRSELIAEALREYEKDTTSYEEALTAYNQLMTEYESQVSPTTMQKPVEPIPPESLESRKMKIDADYPEKTEILHPPKPEQSEETLSYIALRDILDNRFTNMIRSQLQMEQVFTLKLRALKAEGARIAEDIAIGISTEFLEYLMNASLRKLGRLLPRAKRAYLRDPDDPRLVYLVTFEFLEEDLLVSVGNNLLRRE
jgi:hypothetical protein